jgi:hypothetical protein
MSGYTYTGADNRRYGYGIRSVCLGLIRDWKTGNKIISKFTNENMELFNLLTEYGKSITSVPFKTICINFNTIAEKHLDKNNAGISCIVGLGDYTGGELVYGETIVNIHENPVHFDGSKIIHYSLPFVGTRYSVIFFQ